MSNETNINPIVDLIQKLIVFLGRPTVQVQLAAIAGIILLAWLVSIVIRFLIRRLPLGRRLGSVWQRIIPIIDNTIFPFVGLLITARVGFLMLDRRMFIGLLFTSSSVLALLLLYRILIGVLYTVFSDNDVSRFHRRLLSPLFGILISLRIISLVIDPDELAQVVLGRIFENPITVGAAFLATVGLYLYVDAVLGFENIALRLITKYTNANQDMVEATLTVSRYTLIGVGLLAAASSIGLGANSIAAITGGLSVGIGFGLREILGNLVAGILLAFEGALRPSDIVNVDDELSVVEDLRIRSTIVRTENNVERIIPNESFLTESVTTYTGADRSVRMLIPVATTFESDPEEVIEVLWNVAYGHADVLQEPAPEVFLAGFSEIGIDFELGAWVNDPMDSRRITSDLNRGIFKAFTQHQIEIPECCDK